MTATTPSSSSTGSAAASMEHGHGGLGGARRRPLGLMENAIKRKGSFVQLFFMTGILMLSLRSLGQKYRLHDLTGEISELRDERESLSLRMAAVKDSLLHEAAVDPSGLLALHLRRLFGESSSGN